MKRIIFSVFLFWAINSYGQSDIKIEESNQIKITYKNYLVKYPQLFTDFFLYLNESESQFVHTQNPKNQEIDGIHFSIDFHKYLSNYDYQKQKIEENRTLKDSTVLYSQWKNDIVWEIHDEEQEILGYKVKKATTDSFDIPKDNEHYYGKAIAWFAPDIPIPSGPNRYYGLPGLILKLEYSKSGEQWVAQNIDFNSSYTFKELDKENEVAKNDVIYFFHENPKKIKEIQKQNKKKLKK